MTNLNTWDRLIRALLGLLALEAAYFWLAGTGQWVVGAVGVVLLVTALVRFCPLYRVLGISTLTRDARGAGFGTGTGAIAVVLGVAVLAGGSYASAFFTRKLFLEDFSAMNHFYKQTLFLTGKAEREKAIANYDRLLPSFRAFQDKYTAYRPYALKGDAKLGPDLAQVAGMIGGVNDLVRTGDLHQAHLALEKVRPVFQDMFKRNGFSMVAVALVDFHDAMELILDAASAKDPQKLAALYPEVSDKLKAVEAETNDVEIQAIRKNLDDLLSLARAAQADALPARGDALKSSFVKVYLQRG